MKRCAILIMIGVLSFGSTACFKKVIQKFLGQGEEIQAEKVEKRGDEKVAEGKSEEEKNPFEAMQQFAEQMKEASEKQQGGEISVAEEATLSDALPKVKRWNREEPGYSKDRMGQMASSRINAEYRKGDDGVEVTITDTGTMSSLLAGTRMLFASNFSHEDSNGHEKVYEHQGHRGIEKWQKKREKGELSLIVSDRYIVEISGSNGVSIETLRDFLHKVDLESLK